MPIVYTMWANLKKTATMEVGQVGFHDQKAVRKAKVDRKSNDIVNRLEKTHAERQPDLAAERLVRRGGGSRALLLRRCCFGCYGRAASVMLVHKLQRQAGGGAAGGAA